LADPRWIATNLAFLKDLEGISDKSSKYVRPGGKQGDSQQGDDKPKKPGKGQKKGNKKTGPETADEEG